MGIVTRAKCAVAFLHGWNPIPVQCHTKPTDTSMPESIPVGILHRHF